MKTKNSSILLIVCIFFMITISIISIYNASLLSGINFSNLYIKQLTWLFVSLIVCFIVRIIGNTRIYRYSFVFYSIMVLLLILVLFFGTEINGSMGWFVIGGISFQPSELMKIPLILVISGIIENYHFSYKKDFLSEVKLISKVLILTVIPSILVFIEPDTGAVIIYFLIATILLFMSDLRNRWFIILITIVTFIIAGLTILYIFYETTFIDLFGSNIFYRIHRLTDWWNNAGMQLENSLILIANAPILATGIVKSPIYIPEAYSDFIFPIFVNNFGLVSGICLIFVIIVFNLKIIDTALKCSKTIDKYMISGVLVTLLFSQIVSIGMTLGILPIMGIALPFISYGGSSLLAYMIMVTLVINANKNKPFGKK